MPPKTLGRDGREVWKGKRGFARQARGPPVWAKISWWGCGRPISCNVFPVVQTFVDCITFFFSWELTETALYIFLLANW